jgi:hypothetical protein
VTPFAAPSLEHNLIFEKLGRDRRYPTEKLLFVLFICLSKVLPLPTEAGCGSGLILLNS